MDPEGPPAPYRSAHALAVQRAAAKRKKVWPFRDVSDPRGMVALLRLHLEHLKVKGYSERTVQHAEWAVSDFILFCQERDVTKARDVTKPIVERYQRTLFYQRKEDGQPLTFSTQHTRLTFIKQYFRWLARRNHILSNPASEIELPKVEKRLPKYILTASESERVMAQPDVEKPTGMRDRAILETLYSTGVRRTELAHLKIHDIDAERGTLMVRQGKGRKDRVIPIGERAAAFVEKYVRDIRPSFVVEPDEGFLFLSQHGDPLSAKMLSILVGHYVEKADIGKHGACHLFRHAMATLMLENGADVRMIQAMLGHVKLTTTEIYTHVSIKKLKEIHTATHPSARLKPPKAEDEALEEP
jgi:integrase/recombinase XerD